MDPRETPGRPTMADSPTAEEIVDALSTNPELAREVLGKLSLGSPVMETLEARLQAQAEGAKIVEEKRRAHLMLLVAKHFGSVAICQTWTESERGWGTRPDGHTLHLTLSDRDEWVRDHNARLPDETPDCYSRAAGTPYLVDIDANTFESLRGLKGTWGKGNTGPSPSSLYHHDGRAWRPA